jgi:hypothetical protein
VPQPIVDMRRGDSSLGGCDGDLIEPSDNVACCVQSDDRCLLMGIYGNSVTLIASRA